MANWIAEFSDDRQNISAATKRELLEEIGVSSAQRSESRPGEYIVLGGSDDPDIRIYTRLVS